MKRDWDGAELSKWWSLNFDELAVIETKPPRTRLGFAAQLKTYRLAGRFAEHAGEVATEPVAYLAEQLAVAPSDLASGGRPGLTVPSLAINPSTRPSFASSAGCWRARAVMLASGYTYDCCDCQ